MPQGYNQICWGQPIKKANNLSYSQSILSVFLYKTLSQLLLVGLGAAWLESISTQTVKNCNRLQFIF